MGKIMAYEVAEQNFFSIIDDLEIDRNTFEDKEGTSTKKKIVSALANGKLEYEDHIFKVHLFYPIKHGEKAISMLEISEPTGAQLREMASVKDKDDDVGKGLAVLGAITGYGLPVIDKMKSRDLMLSVSVLGLFL